jgi:hypothetical protein
MIFASMAGLIILSCQLCFASSEPSANRPLLVVEATSNVTNDPSFASSIGCLFLAG